MTACQERMRHGCEVRAYSAIPISFWSAHQSHVHCPSEQPNTALQKQIQDWIVLSLLVALRRRSKQHEIQWSLPEYWFSDKSIVLMNKELAIDIILHQCPPKRCLQPFNSIRTIFIACTLTEDKTKKSAMNWSPPNYCYSKCHTVECYYCNYGNVYTTNHQH